MPKISVIVPVYNTEQYLPRCIDSILAQTFTDFELLLIDDGSKDGSGKICDEYAAKDSRIRVFHKENGGVSSARNLGLENAQGEWIAFVDSDDWIKPNYLECMITQADGDLVMSSFEIIDNIEKWDNHIENHTYNKQELKDFISQYIYTETLTSPWCKLFKKRLIGKERFNQSISFAEDTIFTFYYLCHIDRVQTVKNFGYQYRRGINESLSKKRYSIEHYMRIIQEYSKAFKAMEKSIDFDGRTARIYNNWGNFSKCIATIKQSETSLKEKFSHFVNILNDENIIEILKYKGSKGKRGRIFDYLALKRLYIVLFIYILSDKKFRY